MCGIAVGNAHKAAEFSDAVVNVYDVVTDAELLEFLERERYLAVACTVASQAEIVETSEQLMVGEKGYF